MDSRKVALLFPGQGAAYPGVLKDAAEAIPEIGAVFNRIDSVARARFGRTLSDTIWNPRIGSLAEVLAHSSEIVQLSIFGASIAVYRWLETAGVRPDVLIGHSFGELAALVCAGAFTLEEGCEIVCERAEATRLAVSDGYMAALGTDPVRAATLVDLLGNHDIVVAGENGNVQSVLSGVRAKMDRAAEVAKVLNVGFVRLNSPYPFHSPLMEPARAEFHRRLQRFSPRALRVPVFSPILGRYYEPADHLTECLADHLVRPVRFAQAVAQLHADGVGILVECGALDALTKLSKRAAPDADFTGIACLSGDKDEIGSLKGAVAELAALGKSRASDVLRLSTVWPDGPTSPDAEAFWNQRAGAIRTFVEREFERFCLQQAAGDVTQAIASTKLVEIQPIPRTIGRDELFNRIASMYAAALEYPEEVFTPDVALEAELGIDSVKQTELLARVSEEFGLPERPTDFTLANYDTLGKVTDFVFGAIR